MKVGILGSAVVGQTLGKAFLTEGYEVMIGTRNTSKEDLIKWQKENPSGKEDMGKVEAARAIEPLCILWCIPGFIRNQWMHAFKLLKM